MIESIETPIMIQEPGLDIKYSQNISCWRKLPGWFRNPVKCCFSQRMRIVHQGLSPLNIANTRDTDICLSVSNLLIYIFIKKFPSYPIFIFILPSSPFILPLCGKIVFLDEFLICISRYISSVHLIVFRGEERRIFIVR